MADNPYDQWPATEAPEHYGTQKSLESPDAPSIKESKPGYGITDRATYIWDRAANALQQALDPDNKRADQVAGYIRGLMQEHGLGAYTQYAPTLGPPGPVGPAPDRFTRAGGAGLETVIRHPIASLFGLGTTFATGVSNDLLRDQTPEMREAVGAGIGLLSPSGLLHAAGIPIHALAGHFGGLSHIWNSIAHAAPTNIGPRNLLNTGIRAGIGYGIGSEEPLPADSTGLPLVYSP